MFKKKFTIFLKRLNKNHHGTMLMYVLVFGSVAVMIIISGVASYAIFENRASERKHARDMSFHIAEAGIDYYRWHLAHDPTDYKDGTEVDGPYQHEYYDKDGNLIGYYSLNILPPLVGSSVVTASSTGWTVQYPDTTRTIQARVGFPSFANYTFLEHEGMNFSFTSEVFGEVHSNGEIRFDGTAHSWIKSADRVYGGGGPKSFWKYPVVPIDFDGISVDLDDLRDMAILSNSRYTSSGDDGWHIVFNGTEYDLYKVNSRDCYYGQGRWRHSGWYGWYWDGDTYCYDIGTETYQDTYDLPSTGAIFFEDDVWVEGTVDGRVTVGSGSFPDEEPYFDVYIADDLRYTAQSSDDVIGVMAQGEIIIPYEVPDDMYIDGAFLSQHRSVNRPYYNDDLKDSLTVFGAQISYEGGGFKYVNGWGNVISGFEDTLYIYDSNLRYYPPPGFPVGDTYELISWEEIE